MPHASLQNMDALFVVGRLQACKNGGCFLWLYIMEQRARLYQFVQFSRVLHTQKIVSQARQAGQGEDKPSPLLWTDALGRRIRKHSRGDGLSSPWFLSSTLSLCSCKIVLASQ